MAGSAEAPRSTAVAAVATAELHALGFRCPSGRSGRPLATGIVSGVPLQGSAQAVVVEGSNDNPAGQIAYVATSSGLSIVNTTNLLKPVVLSRLSLGNLSTIAVDSSPTARADCWSSITCRSTAAASATR